MPVFGALVCQACGPGLQQGSEETGIWPAWKEGQQRLHEERTPSAWLLVFTLLFLFSLIPRFSDLFCLPLRCICCFSFIIILLL